LLAPVCQRVHPHLAIKALLVGAVLALYFPIVPRRSDSDPMVFNAHLHQCFLKQCFVLAPGYSIFQGTWIAKSRDNAFLLLGSENENAMKCLLF